MVKIALGEKLENEDDKKEAAAILSNSDSESYLQLKKQWQMQGNKEEIDTL